MLPGEQMALKQRSLAFGVEKEQNGRKRGSQTQGNNNQW